MAFEDRRTRFNLSGQLDTGVSQVADSISSSAFENLPTIYSNTIYLPCTIADSNGRAERVFIVGHASASRSVSVVRGREGDTPLTWLAGDIVRCSPTPWDVQRIGGHAGQVGSFTSLTSGGVVLPLAGQDLYGGVTVSSNAIRVPVAGLYNIGCRLYVSGSSGFSAFAKVRRNGADDSNLPRPNLYKVDGQDYGAYASVRRRLAANDALSLVAAGSAGSAYGSTGYDGSYLEVELVMQQ